MAVQSVERALGLFEDLLFNDPSRDGRSLAQLAESAGLAKNTTHNILKTLVNLGYVGRGENDLYVAGPMCREIAQAERWRNGARRRILRPYVERLAGELHEGVNFTIMVGAQRREVINVESDQAVRVDHHTASNFSPYRLVSVRTLLAGTSGGQVEKFVEQHGFPCEDWDGIEDMQSLESALEVIRKDGYCVLAPNVPDVASLAVLVHDRAGRFAGALGCYVPMFRYSDKLEKKILKNFKKAGEELSHEL